MALRLIRPDQWARQELREDVADQEVAALCRW